MVAGIENAGDTDFERFEEFIKDTSSEDEFGVVIRTHTRIHQLVASYIRNHLTRPQKLDGIGLDFGKLVSLAIALGFPEDTAKSLMALGRIRNKFAHDIHTNLTKAMVDGLYKTLTPRAREQVQTCFEGMKSNPEFDIPEKRFRELNSTKKLTLIAGAIWINVSIEVIKTQSTSAEVH